MRFRFPAAIFCTLLVSPAVSAQGFDFTREIELGAIFTAGNTEDQNIKVKTKLEAERERWLHSLTVDAFRSRSEDELTAQRFYGVASTTYSFSEDQFFLTRLAHEDDRFSGYDSQSDLSFNYGQTVLKSRDNMGLALTVGAGIRYSRLPDDEMTEGLEDDFREAFFRLGAKYNWDISGSARFEQNLSTEIGEENTISRWESAVVTDIRDDLSMKLSLNMKHQSEVPDDRENTDSEVSVTLLLRI